MGRKLGAPPFVEWERGPRLTQSRLGRGLSPISVLSGILIHAAIWPQHIWVKKWGLYAFGKGGAGRDPYAMVPTWRFLATFLCPVFSASRVQQVSDLQSKFALRPHHVWKYGRHPISDR